MIMQLERMGGWMWAAMKSISPLNTTDSLAGSCSSYSETHPLPLKIDLGIAYIHGQESMGLWVCLGYGSWAATSGSTVYGIRHHGTAARRHHGMGAGALQAHEGTAVGDG